MINTRPQVPGEVRRSPNRIFRFFINFLLPLAALACGAAITFHLLKTGPEAKPRKRPPAATLVEVMQVTAAPQPTVISAMGEIVPAREVDLKPRVSGEILEIDRDFIPGGHFAAGETMLKIDRADYELAAEQLASQALQAKSDLAMEMGNQRIASREFELMGESVSDAEKELILRKPQLEKLRAASKYAESKLAKARLDLTRTEIKAPFNGVITSREVDTGTRVSESTTLARLVGTDSFWLQLTLPVEQLGWVHIPGSTSDRGATVKIYPQSSGAEKFRTGEVIRLDAALEAQGRMARLLVEIKDPLSLQKENREKPRLLLGSYVRAEIEGIPVDSGIRLSRANLHDNETVWLMDEGGRLEVRPVQVLFREQDHVIINGSIKNGEQIVTSSLASPVPGIPLRLKGDTDSPPKGMKKNGQGKGKGAGRKDSAE